MDINQEKLIQLEQKIDAVYASVEKSRKYLLSMVIATCVMVALPLILAAFILPVALSSLGNAYQL